MAVLALAPLLALTAWSVSAEPAAIELVPHRAVYELSLGKVRGKASIQSARGRILYDFSGNACEGYALEFRQVAELDNGEGRVTLSDLRSTTWEDGDAKNYRFMSQNYLNQKLLDRVDGKAERQTGAVVVMLTRPQEQTLKFDAATDRPEGSRPAPGRDSPTSPHSHS